MAENTKRRKLLAVLAAGLVLGIGTAVTLASWNDSEFATGEFTGGRFDLQGSTTSATAGFADHDVTKGDGAAQLAFSAPFDNLAPGQVVYSPFWLRLDAGTTTGATLASASATATGANAANLSYSVYAIGPTAACDASATTGSLVASGASLTAFTPGSTVALDKGASAGAPGTAAQLCFVVTAGPSLAQGAVANATWSFTATSN